MRYRVIKLKDQASPSAINLVQALEETRSAIESDQHRIYGFNSQSSTFIDIGTPENFFDLLRENKIKVKKKMIFPDHFNYISSDIERIISIAKKNNLKIITTEKDFMKIKKFKKHDIKFTNIDLKIDKFSFFKKFLVDNI